jgi:hypothetical protein
VALPEAAGFDEEAAQPLQAVAAGWLSPSGDVITVGSALELAGNVVEDCAAGEGHAGLNAVTLTNRHSIRRRPSALIDLTIVRFVQERLRVLALAHQFFPAIAPVPPERLSDHDASPPSLDGHAARQPTADD